jgi:hypothetical protein
MGDIRKCARCGCLYITDTDVCQECKKKDSVDLKKLRGFIDEGMFVAGTTRQDILNNTGISAKNLNRYLGYEEFANIYLAESANVETAGNILKGAELDAKGTIKA